MNFSISDLKRRRVALHVAMGILLSASAGLAQTETKFRPGEGMRVVVWRDLTNGQQNRSDDLNIAGDFLIDGKGNILIPILGEVKAAGHTPQSLAKALKESLVTNTIRIPVLDVVCLPLMRVVLLGEVQKPASYLIQPRESLWELIQLAGGPANGANLKNIKVVRSSRTVNNNLLEGFEKAHSLDQLGIQSGDQVIVPAVKKVTVGEILNFTTFAMSVAIFYLQVSSQ